MKLLAATAICLGEGYPSRDRGACANVADETDDADSLDTTVVTMNRYQKAMPRASARIAAAQWQDKLCSVCRVESGRITTASVMPQGEDGPGRTGGRDVLLAMPTRDDGSGRTPWRRATSEALRAGCVPSYAFRRNHRGAAPEARGLKPRPATRSSMSTLFGGCCLVCRSEEEEAGALIDAVQTGCRWAEACCASSLKSL